MNAKQLWVATGAGGARLETGRWRLARVAQVLMFLTALGYASDGRAQSSLAEAFSKTLTSKAEPESEAKPPASDKPKRKPKPKARSKAKTKGAAKSKAKAKPSPSPSPSPSRSPSPDQVTAKPTADGVTGASALPNAAAALGAVPAAAPSAAAPSAAAPSAAAPSAAAPSAAAPSAASVSLPRAAPPPVAPPPVATPPVATRPADTAVAVAAESPVDEAASDALEHAVTEASPLRLAMFVDAYAAFQTNDAGTLATLSGHRAFSGQGSTFLSENGFGLAFLGLDASYETRHFGATANLRFGQAAPLYHAHAEPESDFTFGIELLTQAYLTWRPSEPLALDLGMFGTPFGAEVLESWRNLNYTRGALYYYAQPAWHTGLRLQYDFADELSVVGFVANGSNNISETQQGFGLDQTPTFGAQLQVTPFEPLSLALGGLFTLDGYNNDDAGFDGFADLVATLDLGGLHGVFNADYILTREGAPDESDRQLFGFSLGLGYALSEHFALAARGEYLLDDANFDGDTDQWRLLTATLTFDYKPFGETPNLIIRWDNRGEQSNQAIFGADSQGTADTADDTYRNVWFESVLGVVVTTAP